MELRQVYAFVRRDARTFATYRSWILMTGFGWVTSALSLVFLGVWNSEIFSAITSLAGLVVGTLIGSKT